MTRGKSKTLWMYPKLRCISTKKAKKHVSFDQTKSSNLFLFHFGISVLNTSVSFPIIQGIFLVSLIELKFKDAQTAARLVECQVGNNILYNQIQSYINGDPVLKGNSCFNASPVVELLKLLLYWNFKSLVKWIIYAIPFIAGKNFIQ